jgi:hypothetical protein
MPEFHDLKSLNDFLEKQYMIDFMTRIGKEVFDILYAEVNVGWYQRAYTPQQYERTMQLLHSITVSPVKKINGEYQVEIYYDTDKIIPLDGTADKPWSRHMSIIDGSDWSDAIPYFVEYGNGDSLVYQFEGTHPVENTYKQLLSDNHLLTRFRELFAIKGIKCI